VPKPKIIYVLVLTVNPSPLKQIKRLVENTNFGIEIVTLTQFISRSMYNYLSNNLILKTIKFHLRYFISIILLFLFSCHKNFDIIDSLQNDESGQLSIQDAQQWFNKQHSNVNNSRQSAENTKAPNWSHASSLDFEFGEGIVVPLAYQQNYSVSFIKNKKDTKQKPKATMSLNSLNYLVVYKDKDNKYVEQVVSIIPEEEYVLKSNYMKGQNPFDGMIQVRNWEDKLIKGYVYENGKRIGDIVDTKNKKVLLLDCYETSYYLCPPENLTSSGEIINYAGCDYLSTSSACFTNIGSSTGDGGDSGYSSILGFNYLETPTQKAAKLAAKVRTEYREIGKCIQFANALKKAMQSNNISGKFLEVKTNTSNEFIFSSLHPNQAISETGLHVAIRVGDTVFDNVNYNGVDYNSWRNSLDALHGITITPTDF
jgi:hypothetical protein